MTLNNEEVQPPTNESDIRSISLTPALSKILEDSVCGYVIDVYKMSEIDLTPDSLDS